VKVYRVYLETYYNTGFSLGAYTQRNPISNVDRSFVKRADAEAFKKELESAAKALGLTSNIYVSITETEVQE
jgi:hypothetical protein